MYVYRLLEKHTDNVAFSIYFPALFLSAFLRKVFSKTNYTQSTTYVSFIAMVMDTFNPFLIASKYQYNHTLHDPPTFLTHPYTISATHARSDGPQSINSTRCGSTTAAEAYKAHHGRPDPIGRWGIAPTPTISLYKSRPWRPQAKLTATTPLPSSSTSSLLLRLQWSFPWTRPRPAPPRSRSPPLGRRRRRTSPRRLCHWDHPRPPPPSPSSRPPTRRCCRWWLRRRRRPSRRQGELCVVWGFAVFLCVLWWF